MVGLLLAVPGGCTSAGSFACSDHDECANGSVAGWCEVDGYCSFPDDACPSGRRYGNGPERRQGTCVNDSPSAQTGSSTTSATAEPTASETLDPDPSSTSGPVSAGPSSTTEPTPTTSEATTGEPSCVPCEIGEPCTADEQCASGLCDGNQCVLPASCAQIVDGTSEGIHDIDPDGAGGEAAFAVRCDAATDGGGWTLIGSVVNDGQRNWDTLEVFLDASVLGEPMQAESADFKGPAWSKLAADDLLVRTDEYAVAWSGVLGGRSFAQLVGDEWDDAACSTTFLAGTPPYAENLDDAQQAMFDLLVRPRDSNSTCWPDAGEGTVIAFTLQVNWTNGLGNRPGGATGWGSHDLSLLNLANLAPVECDPSVYPCNPAGYAGNASCYEVDCKSSYATLWVR